MTAVAFCFFSNLFVNCIAEDFLQNVLDHSQFSSKGEVHKT